VRYDEKSAESRQRELWAHLRRKRLEPVLALQADLLSASFRISADKAELQVLAADGGSAAASIIGPRR
jgi:hypothetical protein